jgi:hypothetical protein
MTFTAPWEQHNYIGQHATDAAATSEVVALGWDSGGSPQEGQYYYNTAEEKFKFWRDVSTGWEGQAVAAAQTVTVAESGGDFDSIKDAIDSITDASSSKPYVVLVYPGVYSEDPITLKAFVAVEGVAVGASIVTPTNNSSPLFTPVTSSSIRKLYIFGPTSEAAIKAGAGVSNVQVEDCFFSGFGSNQTAIHATGSGALIIVEECKFFSAVGQGMLAESSGRIDCSNVLSYATTFAYANGGTIWVHNSGCQSGTNGFYANNGGTIYGIGVTAEGMTNAIRLGSTGTNEITGVGWEVRLSVTYDVLQENSTGTLAISGSRLDIDKFSITNWDIVNPDFGTTIEGNQRFVVSKDLDVGVAELGRDTHLGEGPSYTRGMKVITSDSTATSTTDGGNLTDVSTAAASPTGSTFTFQGTAANHCIYFGSSLSDGSDVLKHWALKLKQTTAAVEATTKSFAIEIWDGSAWSEITVMAVESQELYRYANELFIRANSDEYVMYGIDADTTWSKKTISGNNLYWARIRVTNALTTAPVFEQAKLTPSSTEAVEDGSLVFQGLARFRQTILGAGNIFGEDGGVTSSSPAVGSGGVPTGWNHNVKNSLLNGNGDTIFAQFTIPRGTDTSQPLEIRAYITPVSGGAGTVSLIASLLPLEASGILEADPTGGSTPVARTLANTETTTAKAAQTDTQTYTSGTTNKVQAIDFGPYDVSDYYEGDLLLLYLEMDDDGGGNADTLVWLVEIAGAKFTEGERLG